MNILIFGQVPPPYHGTNVMTKVFIDAIDELGYKYRVKNKSFSLMIEEIGGYSIKKIKRVLSVYLGFIKAIRDHEPDVVIIFFPKSIMGIMSNIIPMLTCQIFRVPIILRMGATGYKKLNNSIKYKILIDLILKNNFGLIIQSELFRNDVEYLSDNIYILPNCIEKEFQHYVVNHHHNNNHNNKEKTNILFLSNLDEEKGVLTLLDAANIVLKKYNNVQFNLVGRTTRDGCFYFKNKINNNINILGPKYGKDKFDEYMKNDIFILPTYYYNEAFPSVIIEAMACGLPVISTDYVAIPSIVSDGVTGFIIPPRNSEALAEKIIYLLENPSQRMKMGMMGKNKCLKEYSYYAYKQKLSDILLNIEEKINEK